MLKLIDKKQTKKMTVEDTVIYFKPFSNGQKIRVGHLMTNLGKTGDGWDECFEIVATVITKIEGLEHLGKLDVLKSIEDPDSQTQILIEILKESGLTDDESKNLQSLLDSNLMESESTGIATPDPKQTTDQKDV